jgi:hypothetical protein
MLEWILSHIVDSKAVDSLLPNLLELRARRFGATKLQFLVHSPWHNVEDDHRLHFLVARYSGQRQCAYYSEIISSTYSVKLLQITNYSSPQDQLISKGPYHSIGLLLESDLGCLWHRGRKFRKEQIISFLQQLEHTICESGLVLVAADCDNCRRAKTLTRAYSSRAANTNIIQLAYHTSIALGYATNIELLRDVLNWYKRRHKQTAIIAITMS